MGELADPAALAGLVAAIGDTYGGDLAEKFLFANAEDFLRHQLPIQ